MQIGKWFFLVGSKVRHIPYQKKKLGIFHFISLPIVVVVGRNGVPCIGEDAMSLVQLYFAI